MTVSSSLTEGSTPVAAAIAGAAIAAISPALPGLFAWVALPAGLLAIGGCLLMKRDKAQADATTRLAAETCRRIETGDFEARINTLHSGRHIELHNAINALTDRCDAFVREARAAMEHASRKIYYRKIMETGMDGVYLQATKVVNASLANM